MSEVTKKSEKVTTTQARCSFSVGVTPHIMCSFIHYSRLHINILDIYKEMDEKPNLNQSWYGSCWFRSHSLVKNSQLHTLSYVTC